MSMKREINQGKRPFSNALARTTTACASQTRSNIVTNARNNLIVPGARSTSAAYNRHVDQDMIATITKTATKPRFITPPAPPTNPSTVCYTTKELVMEIENAPTALSVAARNGVAQEHTVSKKVSTHGLPAEKIVAKTNATAETTATKNPRTNTTISCKCTSSTRADKPQEFIQMS